MSVCVNLVGFSGRIDLLPQPHTGLLKVSVRIPGSLSVSGNVNPQIDIPINFPAYVLQSPLLCQLFIQSSLSHMGDGLLSGVCHWLAQRMSSTAQRLNRDVAAAQAHYVHNRYNGFVFKADFEMITTITTPNNDLLGDQETTSNMADIYNIGTSGGGEFEILEDDQVLIFDALLGDEEATSNVSDNYNIGTTGGGEFEILEDDQVLIFDALVGDEEATSNVADNYNIGTTGGGEFEFLEDAQVLIFDALLGDEETTSNVADIYNIGTTGGGEFEFLEVEDGQVLIFDDVTSTSRSPTTSATRQLRPIDKLRKTEHELVDAGDDNIRDQLGDGGECCSICMEDYVCAGNNKNMKNIKLVRFGCTHIYHLTCILQWLDKHNSCPLCRRRLY